jgi:uncharacterized protein YeaO (DUF488 family)
MIATKRAYEPFAPSDGYRVLVDRLWPRGVSKANAHLDAWEKAIAPSRTLREWYQHDVAKWPEFQRRYEHELQSSAAQAVLDDLARRARRVHERDAPPKSATSPCSNGYSTTE